MFYVHNFDKISIMDKSGRKCIDGKQVIVDREKYNDYIRAYRHKNQQKIRRYYRKYNSEWRKKNGYHNELNSKKRYPHKQYAREQALYAIRTGRLQRQPCEACGSIKAQAHHPDYNKPLEVRWFCATHHNEHERGVAFTPKTGLYQS